MRSQRALFALFICLGFAACATNPATGRTELNFFSDDAEIALGRDAHEDILRAFPVYDEKPHLNEMVDRIGHSIAARSPRPNLPWTFTLLDTPMVNAMALPGGYIYVTRGILERMSSEDELAGVIGHEVAHVAARHSTHAMSTGTMTQLGILAAVVVAGGEDAETYGALAMIGAGLLFTKYSRQQETEADLIGTRYMATTGYNPAGSEYMLRGLQRLGGSPDFLERYFMDHPDPAKRVADVRREIATLQGRDAAILDRAMDRDTFVRALDGMITGNSTHDTTIRNGVVYNRSYGVVARAPRGWQPVLESGSLFAMYRGQQEVVYAQELTEDELADHRNPRAAVSKQLEDMGLQHDDARSARTGSGETVTVDFWSGSTDDGTKYSVASTQYGGRERALALLHLAHAGQGHASFLDVLGNLRIDPGEARALRIPRLRVAAARRGDTWQSLSHRATGTEEHAEEIAHINGFDFPSVVPAGILVKLPEDVARAVE